MANTYNVQIEDSTGNKYCPKPDLLVTKEELEANTNAGKSVDALVVKELNNNLTGSLGGFTPVIDSTGKITGYKTQAGADTVFPFSSKICDLLWIDQQNVSNFSKQKMDIDLSNYDSVLIFFRHRYANNAESATIYNIKVGYSKTCYMSSSNNVNTPTYRTVTVSTTGIQFSNGYYTNNNEHGEGTNNAIPCKIYGLKGIQL